MPSHSSHPPTAPKQQPRRNPVPIGERRDAKQESAFYSGVASVRRPGAPGTGELDDVRVLKELDGLGYDGFVGCEYRPAAGTLAGLTWREKL